MTNIERGTQLVKVLEEKLVSILVHLKKRSQLVLAICVGVTMFKEHLIPTLEVFIVSEKLS